MQVPSWVLSRLPVMAPKPRSKPGLAQASASSSQPGWLSSAGFAAASSTSCPETADIVGEPSAATVEKNAVELSDEWYPHVPGNPSPQSACWYPCGRNTMSSRLLA